MPPERVGQLLNQLRTDAPAASSASSGSILGSFPINTSAPASTDSATSMARAVDGSKPALVAEAVDLLKQELKQQDSKGKAKV